MTFPYSGKIYSLTDVPPLLWGQLWPTHFLPDALKPAAPQLTLRLLADPATRVQFLAYYKLFLEKIFNKGSPLLDRIDTFGKFLRLGIYRDNWFELDRGASGKDVDTDVWQNIIPFVKERMEKLPEALNVNPWGF